MLPLRRRKLSVTIVDGRIKLCLKEISTVPISAAANDVESKDTQLKRPSVKQKRRAQAAKLPHKQRMR